jgi:LysM repeat protein/3D (Asp-Asp-Asp) domain-containing protein
MLVAITTRGPRLIFAVGLALAASGAGAANAQVQPDVHVVQDGETVRGIANAYGLSSVSVMAANSMPKPDVLQVGQSLVIPPVDGVLHTVKPGDTLLGIAEQYQVSAADIVAANAMASSDQLAIDDVLVIPGVGLADKAVQAAASQAEATVPVKPRAERTTDATYVVQDGDTLRSIAEHLQLDILSIVAMNGIDDPDLIRPGSELHVSAHPPEHVVQPGDTLGDIAWHYSVDANALLRANGLDDPNHLVTGMTLVVPIGAAAAPVQTAGPAAPAAPVPQTAPAPAPQRAPAPAPASDAAPAPAASTSAISAMVTGYAVGAGAVSSRTASGTQTHWGTVAADVRIYPFGTRLRIEGLGDTVFTVEDTGSAVRGNVFDVWYPDAASARRLGATKRQVSILAPGQR